MKSDNVQVIRAGTIILQAEKSARKPGFACITLLFGVLLELVKSRDKLCSVLVRKLGHVVMKLLIEVCSYFFNPVLLHVGDVVKLD